MLFVGSKTFVGDVSVTSFNMDASWNRKQRTYRTLLEENTHMTLFPFIASTKGTFHTKTLSMLQEIQRDTLSHSLVSEILSLSLFEMFKGIFIAYQLLQTKGYLENEIKQKEQKDCSGAKTPAEGKEQQTGQTQANEDEEIVQEVADHTQETNESERKKEEPSAKKTRKEKPD